MLSFNKSTVTIRLMKVKTVAGPSCLLLQLQYKELFHSSHFDMK